MKRRDFLAAATGAITAPIVWNAHGLAQSDKRYKACIIGDTQQGGYGHDLHLVWALRHDVDVVGLADPHEEGRMRRAQESGAARTYADYREMLDKERPDLVAIGPRWTIHHKEYLLACAAAGAHGIMEKPLTPDLAEADEVMAAMQAKNLKWAIAFNFRASPEIAHARKLLFEDGLIGDILEVRSRGKEDHRAGGEDMIVLGVHIVDAMRYLLGDPEWCMAHIAVEGRTATRADIREATESLGPIMGDTVHAMWGFPGGIPGYFASAKNKVKNPAGWGIDIFGTSGMASMRMDSVPQITYRDNPVWTQGEWRHLPDMPVAAPRTPQKVAHYAPIIDDLMIAIEEDREPAVSVNDGRAATEMIQSVFEAHLRGERIAMPLKNRTHPLR